MKGDDESRINSLSPSIRWIINGHFSIAGTLMHNDRVNADKIINRELSYLVNGCVFDVHNEVRPGLREECFQKAMEQRLVEKGIPFLRKPATRSELVHRGKSVDVFEPDLVIADQLILELKHHTEGFSPENFTQLICYLKFWQMRLGMLVNFAMDRAIIERVPYDPRDVPIEEDYDHVADLLRPRIKTVFHTIRDGILELHRVFGVGYPSTTCRKLAVAEWRSRGLSCFDEVNVEPTFHERRLPRSNITPVLVEKIMCVQVDAIYDDISARAVRTMQTHLRLTGCVMGLIVVFGKTKLMIRGVRR